MQRNFTEKEVPYEELNQLGVSREQFLDLPKQVIEHLMTGRLSPLLMFDFKKGDKLYRIPAKVSLVRGADSQVHLQVHQIQKEVDNVYALNPQELERLHRGEAVLVTTYDQGSAQRLYVQMDAETKTLMTARKQSVYVPNAIGDIVLGREDKEDIRYGKPIELQRGQTLVTVGVDLNSPGGFKVVEGDLGEWQRRQLIEWDKATPGVKGYWKTTDNVLAYEAYQQRHKGVNLDEDTPYQSASYHMKR